MFPLSRPRRTSHRYYRDTYCQGRDKGERHHRRIARGYQALQAIAYFIDDAILLEQSRVRILHGTGTGALRELVRQYLSGVNGVKNYHDEHVQFGGAGITVAELA